jgi:hypothetical protein
VLHPAPFSKISPPPKESALNYYFKGFLFTFYVLSFFSWKRFMPSHPYSMDGLNFILLLLSIAKIFVFKR